MVWTIRGSNPGGARFSAPVQTGPGVHPASYTIGTGSFPGVKRPGRGVDQPPPSSPEVKERVELHLYSSSGPSWPVLGWTFTFISCSVMTPCLIMNWGRPDDRRHWVMPVIERQALGHAVVQAVVTGLSPGRDRVWSQVRSSGIRSE